MEILKHDSRMYTSSSPLSTACSHMREYADISITVFFGLIMEALSVKLKKKMKNYIYTFVTT